jgi:hypothetical protein
MQFDDPFRRHSMTRVQTTWIEFLEANGYAIIPNVIDQACVQKLINTVSLLGNSDGARARNAGTYAVRNLLNAAPLVRALSSSSELKALVEPVLGSNAHAVRGILFDKTPGANWKVAWHQDLSIAVKEKVDAPGFGPWSMKAGVVHVQPPVDILQNMLTVRLHLDDCGTENGPLQVLPGSHLKGLAFTKDAGNWRERITTFSCNVRAGDVTLMRPLLLHASSPATLPRHRRVIHLEYAAANLLPAGMQWHDSSRAGS